MLRNFFDSFPFFFVTVVAYGAKDVKDVFFESKLSEDVEIRYYSLNSEDESVAINNFKNSDKKILHIPHGTDSEDYFIQFAMLYFF